MECRRCQRHIEPGRDTYLEFATTRYAAIDFDAPAVEILEVEYLHDGPDGCEQ